MGCIGLKDVKAYKRLIQYGQGNIKCLTFYYFFLNEDYIQVL